MSTAGRDHPAQCCGGHLNPDAVEEAAQMVRARWNYPARFVSAHDGLYDRR